MLAIATSRTTIPEMSGEGIMTTGCALYLIMCLVMFGGFSVVLACDPNRSRAGTGPLRHGRQTRSRVHAGRMLARHRFTARANHAKQHQKD